MPTYLPQGSYRVFYQIFGAKRHGVIGQGTLDLAVLPAGTLAGYIGYGFWGISWSEKFITFGIIFLFRHPLWNFRWHPDRLESGASAGVTALLRLRPLLPLSMIMMHGIISNHAARLQKVSRLVFSGCFFVRSVSACACAIYRYPRPFVSPFAVTGSSSRGEFCDDGTNNGQYATSSRSRNCLPDCSGYGPYCGDGILQPRFGEQCDDSGNNISGDGCSATCQIESTAPLAGPGIVGWRVAIPDRNYTPPNPTEVIIKGSGLSRRECEYFE